jgi:hypothetical protein
MCVWYPGMAMSLLSVAQLVDRTAPPTEYHRSLWLRRAQHWSGLGILPTARPQDGSRKRRLYREETVYLAAVLLRLSGFGIETSILEWISTHLQQISRGRGRFARFWRDAIQGNRQIAYISISLSFEGQSFHYYNGLTDAVTPALRDEPAIFLNLAGVFEEVRHAAEE